MTRSEGETMKNHKDLLVWQKSIAFVKELYKETSLFPKEEIYGITSQIRRAAVSIPSNISEGYGRGHDKEIVHFLYISLGSASEVETQIILCKEIGYLSDERYEFFMNNVTEIIRMLSSLLLSTNVSFLVGFRMALVNLLTRQLVNYK